MWVRKWLPSHGVSIYLSVTEDYSILPVLTEHFSTIRDTRNQTEAFTMYVFLNVCSLPVADIHTIAHPGGTCWQRRTYTSLTTWPCFLPWLMSSGTQEHTSSDQWYWPHLLFFGVTIRMWSKALFFFKFQNKTKSPPIVSQKEMFLITSICDFVASATKAKLVNMTL